MSNLDFHFTECLILSSDSQKPQVKTSKDGKTNWFEFNVLVSKKNKNDESKKDINIVVKVLCFSEKIKDTFMDKYKEDENNFFTGSCRLNQHMIKQFEENGKTHNYYKYFACCLEDFKFVISYSDKNNNYETTKGWGSNDNEVQNSTSQQNVQEVVIDDDIPF